MRIEGTQLCSREVEVEAEAEGECLERCANRSSVEGAILLVVAHHERRAVRGNQSINQSINQSTNQQQTAILCAFDHLRFGLFGKLRQRTSLLCCFVCGWDSRHRRGFPVQC
jgi:hypothetical protein